VDEIRTARLVLRELLARAGRLGQGYATGAAAALLRFGFARLGLHKIGAACDPAGAGSARVLEKLGTLRIEPAAPDDVPRLLEIRHAAFTAHATAAYSAQEVATLLADVDPDQLSRMAEAGTLYVARRPDRIAGLAGRRGTAWDGSAYLEMQKEL
jgi:hypothetical protein